MNPVRVFKDIWNMPRIARKQQEVIEIIKKDIKEERSKREKLEKENARLEFRIRQLERKQYYFYSSNIPSEDYPKALSIWYQHQTGSPLDLNNPKTYNEKIQWFKLYGITPEITSLCDKIKVREFVSTRVGDDYLIPLLGVWERPEDIDFETLPEQFVLKANHGSGYTFIVTDKSKSNKNDFMFRAKRWLAEDFSFIAGFEMQYHDIPRRIIAEKYLENSDGNLNDYKFRCFNGKVELIAVVTNRSKGLKMDWFDREWNTLPIIYNEYPHSIKPLPRPDNLGEMIEMAEILATGFPHVRVDLYRMNDGRIYFGEMTFTPSSGAAKWDPPELDLKLGQLFTYPGMPK